MRYKRTQGTTVEYYVYDGDDVLGSYTAGGTLNARYVTPGLDDNLSETRGGSTYYYMQDGLGSVRNLVDADEAAQNIYDTYAFGNALGTQTTGVASPYRYTARDYESGGILSQHYYRNRYYLPSIGIFASRDAIWADVTRGWGYASNNPLMFVDPWGLDEHEIFDWHWSDVRGMAGALFGTQQEEGARGTVWGRPGFSGALGRQALGMPAGILGPVDWILPGAPVKDGLGAAADWVGAKAGLNEDPCEKISDNDDYKHGMNTGPLLLGVVALWNATYGAGSGVVNAGTEATALARRLGQEGEAAVGIVGPKVGIRMPNGQIRFPDALGNGVLTEVKNVGSLSYTRQLRDYAAFSRQNGLQFNLYTRQSTELSGPLAEAIARGEITHKFIGGIP